MIVFPSRRIALAAGLLVAFAIVAMSPAAALPTLSFIPATRAHQHSAGEYEAIWAEYGERIVAALEARTCLAFVETSVAARIDDAVSHSGGPEHPMRLRATYSRPVKQATLVHELGHRHLWQLEERLDALDGHETLYLVLDRVWADVWGEDFAAERIADESSWNSGYDYSEAWARVASMSVTERERIWRQLLQRNGFEPECGHGATNANPP